MSTCFSRGFLVNGEAVIPTDPTDLMVENLAIVGCSHLVCAGCGATVRNAIGLSFRTKDDRTDLAQIYATTDLAAHPALQPARADYRLYLCKCSRWLETSQSELGDPDPDPDRDPTMPWGCAGHPVLSIPGTVDGVEVGTRAELQKLVVAGFHGVFPPAVRRSDTQVGWMARLYRRLPAQHAAAVVDAAVVALHDPEIPVRGRALGFFRYTPDEAGLTHVAALFDDARPLIDGVLDPIGLQKDDSLADSAWRALQPLIGKQGGARERARADALAKGRGTRALYYVLAAADSSWFAQHVGEIALATPGKKDDLVDSLTQFPRGVDMNAARDRVRVALAGAGGAGAPSFDAAMTAFATRVARARKVGVVPKFRHELPPVDGAAVELEYWGEYPDLRFLELSATTPAGKVHERLFEGADEAARKLAASSDLAARVTSSAKKLVASLPAPGG